MNPKEKARAKAKEAVEQTTIIEEVARIAGLGETVDGLLAAEWELCGVHLTDDYGRKGNIDAYNQGNSGEVALKLVVDPSPHGTVCYVGRLGGNILHPAALLPPGVRFPTPQEAREWYLNDTVPEDAPFRFIVAERAVEDGGE